MGCLKREIAQEKRARGSRCLRLMFLEVDVVFGRGDLNGEDPEAFDFRHEGKEKGREKRKGEKTKKRKKGRKGRRKERRGKRPEKKRKKKRGKEEKEEEG